MEKIEIYTDGACSGNPGLCGIGIVLKCGDNIKEYSQYIGHGTNNIAELSAVLKALKMIRKPQMQVVLYTDSEYALGVLTLGWKAKANKALIRDITDEMKRFRDLKFVKVEGHSDVTLNNRADSLARQGITDMR
ncbi:MAG: ribonuclease H [Pseudomonadota bacterium]